MEHLAKFSTLPPEGRRGHAAEGRGGPHHNLTVAVKSAFLAGEARYGPHRNLTVAVTPAFLAGEARYGPHRNLTAAVMPASLTAGGPRSRAAANWESRLPGGGRARTPAAPHGRGRACRAPLSRPGCQPVHPLSRSVRLWCGTYLRTHHPQPPNLESPRTTNHQPRTTKICYTTRIGKQEKSRHRLKHTETRRGTLRGWSFR